MKPDFYKIITHLVSVACNHPILCRSNEKYSLPGVYLNELSNTYSRVFDMLIIARHRAEEYSYTIERRLSFQKIKNGLLESKEYPLEQWMAFYDQQNKTLFKTQKGKLIVYSPEKRKLFLGNSVYFKI